MRQEKEGLISKENAAIAGSAALGLYLTLIGELGLGIAAGGIAFALNWRKNSKKSRNP